MTARRKSLFATANEGTEEETKNSKRPENAFRERQRVLDDVSSGRRLPSNRLKVDPTECRMWDMHNRRYDLLNVDNCSDLVNRIKTQGQIVPAIVRELKNDPDGYLYEVVAGARRHWSVSYLKSELGHSELQFLIEVRDIADEEAFQISDAENRDRKDISDYERASDYLNAMAVFYNNKQRNMAHRINMSEATLSHYISLAKLPALIIEAYGDPRHIALRHAKPLQALLRDPKKSAAITAEAKSLAAEQTKSRDLGMAYVHDGAAVFKKLTTAADQKQLKQKINREVLMSKSGKQIATIDRGRKLVTVKIPLSAIDDEKEIIAGLRNKIFKNRHA